MFTLLLKFILAFIALNVLFSVEAAVPYKSPYKKDEVDKLAAKGLVKLALYKALHPSASGCTLKNAIKRKEWYAKILKSYGQCTESSVKVGPFT